MNTPEWKVLGLRMHRQGDTPWRDELVISRGSLAKSAVPPARSWWADPYPSREAFYQQAAREAVRMQPATSSAVVTAKDSNGKAH